MSSQTILKKLREIEIIKPSDHVVRQLKELLISGELKPGDVLPSER
ncbi:MAG: GntR family transcriptional regulator, partial [Planctomycetota bacterium]|nr:GntR family transcriptional regulator [Planctomycetota bacterium]